MGKGTNHTGGLGTNKSYSGNTDTMPNGYATGVNTRAIRRTAVIHCLGSEADNAERTTDFTFPDTCIVHDVLINVLTVDATETVTIGTEGTSNDPDGFMVAASLATAGIVKGDLVDGSVTRGELLYEITEATTAAAKSDCVTAGGDPVSFTCSAGTDTAVFDIIIDYTEVFPVGRPTVATD